MRATWMLLLAIAIGLILLQNWSPSLSLVLFGRETVILPLAVWLGLGIFAGIGTSLVIQLLNYRPPAPPKATDPEVAPRYRDTTKKPRRTRPPGKSDWEVSPSADWDPLPEDDGGWAIDEPPAAATIPQANFPQSDLRKNDRTIHNPPRKERPSQRAETNPSDRAENPTPSPKSDTPETPTQSKDGIYDANYRVINPPHGEENEPASEKPENWEF